MLKADLFLGTDTSANRTKIVARTDLVVCRFGFTVYLNSLHLRRGSIIGNAVVLKTTARKRLQVRVLSSPLFRFWIQGFEFWIYCPKSIINWRSNSSIHFCNPLGTITPFGIACCHTE